MPGAPASPPAGAGAPDANPEPAGDAKSTDSGLSTTGMLLAAIGGGIGVLGFVAFFGGAILWVRMDEAGLPGNDAVAIVPRSVLIATGASFLVPSLLIAFAFAVSLYLLDQLTVYFHTRSQRDLEATLLRVEQEAEAGRDLARKGKETVEAVLAQAEHIKAAEQAAAGLDLFAPAEMERRKETTQEAYENAEQAGREACEEAQTAEEKALETKKEVAEKRIDGSARIEKHRKILLVSLTAGLFLGGAIGTIFFFSVHLSPWGIFVLASLALFLTTVCVVVRVRTESFAWLAIATFVAVGLMSGMLTYYRTTGEPKVEPAALLRTHGAPVSGFFVAQTSDRVFLGTTSPGGMTRLDAIPRDEVLSLVIGNLQAIEVAPVRARLLAIHLCTRARERDPPPVRVETPGGKTWIADTTTGCTQDDLHRLHAAVKVPSGRIARG
jgi:F0F1-type ATP synthase assembly protein I